MYRFSYISVLTDLEYLLPGNSGDSAPETLGIPPVRSLLFWWLPVDPAL